MLTFLSRQNPRFCVVSALVFDVACAPPAGDPGPGDAPVATVQLYMNGEIFSTTAQDGSLWTLAAYGPDEGETCMAYGPVEPDPAGGYSFGNLVILTATVSQVSSQLDGRDLLVGTMYSYSASYDMFDKYGSYEYDVAMRSVFVVPEFGEELLLMEAPAEITNDDLLAQVQSCHYFEADASPAPLTRTLGVR